MSLVFRCRGHFVERAVGEDGLLERVIIHFLEQSPNKEALFSFAEKKKKTATVFTP
jgi:hypothetical protein